VSGILLAIRENALVSAGTRPAQQIESRRTAGPSGLSEKWGFALALLLICATVALYQPLKRYPFITYDDRDYVIRNFQIQSGLDRDTVQWAFTTFYSSNWHPLTWLSHALDYQLFRLNPAGHHDTNVLLHALNAALLFWVLWRATGYAGCSFVVAALFALHPINVESVAWVSERKNVLSMFFFLLALGAYRRYALKPRVDRYLAVASLYAFGLMAKPQVITFPCVLLLWDYWPLQRMFAPAADRFGTANDTRVPAKSFGWLLLEKVPLLALSAASAVLTIEAQKASGALNGTFTSYAFPIRLENAIVSYARYIGKAVWPLHLSIFYPHAETLLNPWQVAGAAVLLVVTTALVLAGWRRRYLLVGWFWFLGTLIPMIGLLQVGGQAMADRYAYLPFIGLFLMICWGVADFQPSRRTAESPLAEEEEVAASTGWLTIASLGMLLALTAVAHRQLWYWRDSVALWEHAAEVTEGNWMAEDSLGGLMAELGKPDQALAHFQRALAFNPDDPIANVNIGNWNQYIGKPGEAIEYYQRVLHSPRAPEVLKTKATEGLQQAYRKLGMIDTSGVTPQQP
jgi:protein O-mannosyl-transferase